MDRRDRAYLFRTRLLDAMAAKGMSRSALARAAGVDRSTIGQLLQDDLARLPNAQLTADAATALGVSTDWLLGLTHRPEMPGDIVAAALALSPADRIATDALLLDWHREAAGYKVRHVPATLPDILKTEAMLDWEYSAFRNHGLPEAIDAMRNQLGFLRSGVSDYEIAIPVHELTACLTGTAYYEGCEAGIRHDQLRFIARLCDELFPRLRLFLFDAHRTFSAPATIFGPNLAVLYIGRFYLAFREGERVRSLTEQFDWLVREAVVDARSVPDHIAALLRAPPG